MDAPKKTRGRKATDPNEVIALALEDGLPDRSTIDPHAVRRQLKPKSQSAYNRDLRIWNAYLAKYPNSDPRDMRTMKHFVEAVWRGTKGTLNKVSRRATPRSIRIKTRRFCNAWERENHENIPEEVKYSMAPLIQGELKDKVNAEDIKKNMTFLTIKNYVHMQEQLWVWDHHDYIHDGYRVDNSNLLNTHCYTSARLQEVCQATYKDVEFMVAWKDGAPEFKMGFKREYCKGMDEKQPAHPMAERIEGPDGLPPPLYAQPILHWLANIISSEALKDYHSIEDVLNLKPPENEDFWVMEWAAEMKDKPVFPRWSAEGPLDGSRDPTAWGKQASQWAVRAGFICGFGLHASRREILIKTNDSGKAIGQVLKFAGQRNPKVLLNHYLDDMCTVDGAAVFLDMKPREDLTEDFRSATMKRNAQLPQTLPSAVKAELESQKDYVDLANQLKNLELRIESTVEKETADQLKAERSRLYGRRRKLEGAALKEYQESQVRAYPTKPKEHEQRDWRKGHFDRTRHVKPELDRLARTLSLRVSLRSPEGISALRDLISLRKNDCRVAYQQVLRPTEDGCCPVPSCQQNMEEVPVKKRWQHVFRCYGKHYNTTLGFAQFCYLCHSWKTNKADWEADCQGHIDNQEVPSRCNPVIFRTAVACAGYCPGCMSNNSLPATKRLHPHTNRANWLRHIHNCIPKYIQTRCDPNRMPCPCEQCPVVHRTEADLWHHLEDVHSVPKPADGKRSRDCSEEGPTAVATSHRAAKKRQISTPPASRVSIGHSKISAEPGFANILPGNLPLLSASTMDKILVFSSSSSSLSSEAVTCTSGGSTPLPSVLDTEATSEGYSSVTSILSPSPSSVNIEGVSDLAICEEWQRHLVDGILEGEQNCVDPLLGLSGTESYHNKHTAELPLHEPLPPSHPDDAAVSFMCNDMLQATLEERCTAEISFEPSLLGGFDSHMPAEDATMHGAEEPSPGMWADRSQPAPPNLANIGMDMVDPALRTSTSTLGAMETRVTKPLPYYDGTSHPMILPVAAKPEDAMVEPPPSWLEAMSQSSPALDEAYPVDCLLDKWGENWFFVQWIDGSCSWEPRENILDEKLIEKLKKEYKGLHQGVDVLRIRRGSDGKVQYRVHWIGRDKKEDLWVAEKFMSLELIKKHKPSKKAKRGRRRS